MITSLSHCKAFISGIYGILKIIQWETKDVGHINALLKNLSYSFEVGRISALNMLEKILKKASEEAINAQAKIFRSISFAFSK